MSSNMNYSAMNSAMNPGMNAGNNFNFNSGFGQQMNMVQHMQSQPRYSYKATIAQQPQRCRMCGFGDKDRRPISPPPVVQLIVIDNHTGQEVHDKALLESLSPTKFICLVDLIDVDGNEKNLIPQHVNAPAGSTIGTASPNTVAFPPPYFPTHHPHHVIVQHPVSQGGMQQGGMHQGAPSMHQPSQMHQQHPIHQGSLFPVQPIAPGPQQSFYNPNAAMFPPYMPLPHVPLQDQYLPPHENHTRNLIGTLAVSGVVLHNEKKVYGIYFVFTDLSVRTETDFRLQFKIADIRNPVDSNDIHQGDCPIIAQSRSTIFSVYSAKKFPGVIESTELSRCFASQGVKIPIRKDNGKANDKEYDNDPLDHDPNA